VTRELALRHGACSLPGAAAPRPVRSLEDIAVENAVEGCVRETYAALLAHHHADVRVADLEALVVRVTPGRAAPESARRARGRRRCR
jgi:hypothetical protein